jgi:hypothetical protein
MIEFILLKVGIGTPTLCIKWYIRPEDEGITSTRVLLKVTAEVVLAFWLCPHPRALSRLKHLLLVILYQQTFQNEMFLVKKIRSL